MTACLPAVSSWCAVVYLGHAVIPESRDRHRQSRYEDPDHRHEATQEDDEGQHQGPADAQRYQACHVPNRRQKTAAESTRASHHHHLPRPLSQRRSTTNNAATNGPTTFSRMSCAIELGTRQTHGNHQQRRPIILGSRTIGAPLGQQPCSSAAHLPWSGWC